jgi:hypothetical protein
VADLWGDFGLTLVVLPDGELGDLFLDTARQWTGLSLISPALWVRPMDADVASVPMRQKALVLEHDGVVGCDETEVDVFELLSSRERIAKLRVITVTPLLSRDTETAEHLDKSQALRDYISKSMVLPSSGQSGAESYPTVEFLNLIVSPTEHSETKKILNADGYLATFIASPEDRATPLSADGFIREDELLKFVRFAMMHVATVGGLWSGLSDGILDLVRKDSFRPSSIYVSRVFISGILTEGLAARAVARVLERVSNPDSGFVNPFTNMPIEGTAPITAEEREAYLTLLLNTVMAFEGNALRYSAPIELRNPDQIKTTMKGALKDFGSFAGAKLKSLPLSIGRTFVWWITGIFNRLFFGGTKGHAVVEAKDPNLDSIDAQLVSAWEQVGELRAKADEVLKMPATFSGLRVTPQLWANIREAIFSLLDGSNQERFGFVRKDDADPVYPIFYRAGDLLSDPAKRTFVSDPIQPAGKLELGWADFQAYTDLMALIQKLELQLSQQDKQSRERVQALKTELESARQNVAALESELMIREA